MAISFTFLESQRPLPPVYGEKDKISVGVLVVWAAVGMSFRVFRK